MKKSVNIWIALRDDAQSAITSRLNWDEATQGEYSGPVSNRSARLFRGMSDRGVVQSLFKTATIGGRQYTLWNVYLRETANIMRLVADELDALMAEYPNHIAVIGAWRWDGRLVGTRWVDSSDYSQGTTGNAVYPLHPQALKLMPDKPAVVDPDTGDVITPAEPATVVSDINLLYGQSPRRFS